MVPIESHLHKKLAEFLNAEIVLNTIVDVESSLLQWIRTTFLRTCAVKRQIENRNTDEIDAKLKGKFTSTATTRKNDRLLNWVRKSLQKWNKLLPYDSVHAKLNDNQFWHLIFITPFDGCRHDSQLHFLKYVMI